jgi:predicted MFS family arabinose efflux permease
MFMIGAGAMVILWVLLYFLLPEIYPDFKENYGKLMRSLIHLIIEEPLLRLASIRGSLCYACFGAFWTTLVLLLKEPPYNYGSEVAGAFGLVGAAGALGASVMGRLSDKGSAHRITTGSIALIVLSFIIFGVFSNSIIALVAGVILFDLGVQATHISNQTLIFTLRPDARNRLNTVYMVSYFIGGATGTLLATQAWNRYQWNGVVFIGLLLSSLALLIHIIFIRKL